MGAWSVLDKSSPQPLREWLTLTGRKRVLVVAHTVTYIKRLQEVFSLLESDLRVQVLFTAPPHPFGDGVAQLLHRLGSAVLPWEKAARMEFDLALAAGPRGLGEISAPLITLPHGANYLKRVTEGPETRVAGLGRADIVPDGRCLPAAVVLPHRDDLHGLAQLCPEALPVASVVGDPVHDRIVASLPRRAAYRRALGIRKGQQLIAVVSTWGTRSSFGSIEALLPRLIGELAGANRRVAILLHPNVWSGHGAWQVRAWLARCREYGIAVVPPEADWRSVLLAADRIIGDHGSVTLYGTLTRAPILLAVSPEAEINPASPAATLARTAPALSPGHSLTSQLEYAAAEYREHQHVEYAAIAARITSEPGRFSRNMRALMYRVLGLGQPAHPAGTRPLPLPPPLDFWSAPAADADTGTEATA
ncbi:hypothetical protein [Streptomyces albofaciens]|uniref:hypothetical protein n=1 Tax=Streptomyces albofaciens TaxID=66866 RepID=UPI001AD729CE|nr:hypothetical protein [Streptomyces albofaciens]